jgi:hypothetical protein
MTAQVSETLWYEGKKQGMCSEPLSAYFDLTGESPAFAEMDTSCWRGYVGEWEIRDDRLYLIGLEGRLVNGEEANLESIFPKFPDRVFAHWYSGTIRLPQGKLLNYVHGGYLSVYERDLLLTFEKGIIVGTETRKNDPTDNEVSF